MIPAGAETGVSIAAAMLIIAGGALLARHRTDIVLGILALSVPVQTAIVLPVAGASLTITKLAVVSLVLGWGTRAFRRPIVADRITWGYACVLVAILASVVAVQDLVPWASVAYQWSVALVVYVIARCELRSAMARDIVLVSMAIGVIGVGVYAFAQVVARDGPPSFVVNGWLRAYGTFGQPNPLAAYMELTVPLVLAVLATRIRLDRQGEVRVAGAGAGAVDTVLAGGAVVGMVTLVLTQSRGGLLGMTAALVVLSLLLPLRWRLGALLAGTSSLAIFVLVPTSAGWWDRAADAVAASQAHVQVTAANWAAEERRAHWGAAVRMLLDHPASGIGAGEFDREFRQYTPEWRFRIGRGHAHNGYLHLAAEAGLPGLVAFVTWCGAALTALWARLTRSDDPLGRGYAIGALAGMVAFMVHSMVDYLNVLSLGIQIALMIAAGMTRSGDRSDDIQVKGGAVAGPIAVTPA